MSQRLSSGDESKMVIIRNQQRDMIEKTEPGRKGNRADRGSRMGMLEMEVVHG